jgi:hypothetical protein
LAACAESQLFFINAFGWTLHQHEVDPITGLRIEAKNPHVPFISWEIQDSLFDNFELCLKNGEDILIDKCRDMGASWCCIYFLHWLWLFKKSAKLLEMSRTKEYVDQTDNHKALFQKHDYINIWLPEWMRPPQCLPGERYRSSGHMHNVLTEATIDGESTTPHAGSGDRRLVLLLDEFAKVEHGTKMRSATRDVSLMRIINSTPAGPGTEYSKWKASKQIKVFVMPFWEHPQKGAGRHIIRNEDTQSWEIRSPYYDEEAKVRSPKELAQELLRQDLESGDQFFTSANVVKHKAMFASEPTIRYNINLKTTIADVDVQNIVRRRDVASVVVVRAKEGNLRVWGDLIGGRPDQSKSYIIGCDLSKGQGASNSVLSVKCRDTGEKVLEWRNATTPPYELARVAVALALWVGGRKPHGLPLLKWEMNGPGWDFGRQVVKIFAYPYYYKKRVMGKTGDDTTDSYGWHASRERKIELLTLLDRAMAHGGYVNHSEFALDEMVSYIYFDDGSVGPAGLFKETKSARLTHGDCVIADALTLEEDDAPASNSDAKIEIPEQSFGAMMKKCLNKKQGDKMIRWRTKFNFQR